MYCIIYNTMHAPNYMCKMPAAFIYYNNPITEPCEPCAYMLCFSFVFLSPLCHYFIPQFLIYISHLINSIIFLQMYNLVYQVMATEQNAYLQLFCGEPLTRGLTAFHIYENCVFQRKPQSGSENMYILLCVQARLVVYVYVNIIIVCIAQTCCLYNDGLYEQRT